MFEAGRFVTIQEAAEVLQVSESTIRRAIAAGYAALCTFATFRGVDLTRLGVVLQLLEQDCGGLPAVLLEQRPHERPDHGKHLEL